VDDIDIVKRVQAGDRNAFSLLVEKYHRPLLNFIYRLVGNDHSVEDIGQDVFLNVYKSMSRFDLSEGVPFSAWLFIAARNRCISEGSRIEVRPGRGSCTGATIKGGIRYVPDPAPCAILTETHKTRSSILKMV